MGDKISDSLFNFVKYILSNMVLRALIKFA